MLKIGSPRPTGTFWATQVIVPPMVSPAFLISWNAIMSTSKSSTISDKAKIVESLAAGKNSQFQVIISKSSVFNDGTFQLLYFSSI